MFLKQFHIILSSKDLHKQSMARDEAWVIGDVFIRIRVVVIGVSFRVIVNTIGVGIDVFRVAGVQDFIKAVEFGVRAEIEEITITKVRLKMVLVVAVREVQWCI